MAQTKVIELNEDKIDIICRLISIQSEVEVFVIKTQDPDRFMMIRVLPSIKQTLTEAGYDPAPKNKNDDDSGWDALICFNGKLYQVSDDYGFMRDDKGFNLACSHRSLIAS